MKIRLWMTIFSIIFLSVGLPAEQFTRTFGGKDLDRGIGVTLTHDGGYIR